MEKIFITGLPRTGTTSICVAMLDLGYKVAHTAFTEKSLAQAEVIADTPVFCDYQQLHQQYPDAKFIHLTRELALWVPSIKQLLQRMHKNVTRIDGGFNPSLKHCFNTVFGPLTLENIAQDQFLIDCYEKHLKSLNQYFEGQESKLLTIDVSKPDSYPKLLSFLGKSAPIKAFERINIGGKITAWNGIKHENKIDQNLK